MDTLAEFNDRKTLIVGDVNTGKTARCIAILQQFIAAGRARQITVIDLAPDAVGNVGGKLTVPGRPGLRYLTRPIAAPRLTAADEKQAQALARANARSIERLFEGFLAHPSDILFINDASLYLQAGDPSRLLAVIAMAPTVVMNAYMGTSFPDSALSRREKQMVQLVSRHCDRIVSTA